VLSVLAAGGTAGLPVVTLAWARTSSGAIAAADGSRTAVSGSESLLLTHRLRALHRAILVGIQTVLSDDPLLSVRLVEGSQPRPVVLDSRLRTPPRARLLTRPDMAPWIFHAGNGDPAG
jgi:riboflavin biosynthesis pyrimidine reductase